MPANPIPSASGPKKRSRNGCTTCVTAKVKCSETHPVCQRCTRLGVKCTWPIPRPSLREIRRGHGPLKERRSCPTKAILPIADRLPEKAAEHVLQEAFESKDAEKQGAFVTAWLFDQPNHVHTLPNLNLQGASDDQFPIRRNPEPSHFEPFRGVEGHANFTQLYPNDFSLLPELSTFHIPSPCSLVLGKHEHYALYHYQYVLTKAYTQKHPNWSTSNMILSYAVKHPTIMHLIISAAMSELAQLNDNDMFWSFGKIHFQVGSQLLAGMMDKESELDHCVNMAAFWLLQFTYSTIWGVKGIESMKNLSRAMANYIRKHRLLEIFSTDALCNKGCVPLPAKLQTLSTIDKSVIAKTLVMVFYTDVEMAFCNSGGEFSDVFCADEEIAKNVFHSSLSTLQLFWGDRYPPNEVIDDIKNTSPLEAFFITCLIFHNINISTRNNHPEDFELIEKKIKEMTIKYSHVFRLSESEVIKPSCFVSLIDKISLVFHAVHLYNLRSLESSTISCDVKEKRSLIVKNMLRITKRIVASTSLESRRRNQWSLLIAGIETDDSIYVEWILTKLGRCKYDHILRKRLLEHENMEGKLSVETVRSLCS